MAKKDWTGLLGGDKTSDASPVSEETKAAVEDTAKKAAASKAEADADAAEAMKAAKAAELEAVTAAQTAAAEAQKAAEVAKKVAEQKQAEAAKAMAKAEELAPKYRIKKRQMIQMRGHMDYLVEGQVVSESTHGKSEIERFKQIGVEMELVK